MTETSIEFPIVWDDPAHADGFWSRDRLHEIGQSSTLDVSVQQALFEPGYAAAMTELGSPFAKLEFIAINTYMYARMRQPEGSVEDLERMGEAYRGRLDERGPDQMRLWRETYLPELEEMLARWAAFDPASDDLVRWFDDSCRWYTRAWHIHFIVVSYAYRPLGVLEDWYFERFGTDDAFGAMRLVQGFPNLTVSSGHLLFELSRRVRDDEALRDVVASTPAGDLYAAIDAHPRFRSSVDEYLAFYGRRPVHWGIGETWIEDPTPVMRTLQRYASLGDEHDPALKQRRLAEEREEAVREVRAALDADELAAFDRLLESAQQGNVLTEDHGFYIDFACAWGLRRVLMACADRLVEFGCIDERDDVMHLTLTEIRASLVGRTDRHDVVAERKAEVERFADVDAPESLGTPPAGPPAGSDPTARDRFMGSNNLGTTHEDGVVTGTPGAPGTATGVARLITTLADMDRLEPGEVLVAQTTAPPWTPLFAIAAAVVTDTGGVLSHCAVVAREYGIPAVVNTGSGTVHIPDGSTIEVDGTAGTVRIIG